MLVTALGQEKEKVAPVPLCKIIIKLKQNQCFISTFAIALKDINITLLWLNRLYLQIIQLGPPNSV